MIREVVRLSVALLFFGALLAEAAAEQPSPKAPGLGAPPGFGIGPGIAGGTDTMAAGVDAYGMVPSLVIGPIWMLKLDEQQLRKIDDIFNLQRKQQWAFMYQMMAENARLRKLFQAERWDVGAITDVYDVVYTLRRGRIQSLARLRNQIHDILTPEQRAQLARIREAQPWPGPP